MTTKSINSRLKKIEARNDRVEKDKAWEVSMTRRLMITALIYGIVSLYLAVIGSANIIEGAAVASIGYFISTLIIKSARDNWMKRD